MVTNIQPLIRSVTQSQSQSQSTYHSLILPGLAQAAAVPKPASHSSPTDPVLRANPLSYQWIAWIEQNKDTNSWSTTFFSYHYLLKHYGLFSFPLSAVGEPPVVLASSALFAIKEACAAARSDAGQTDFFTMSELTSHPFTSIISLTLVKGVVFTFCQHE